MAEVQRDTMSSREDTMRFADMVGLFGSQAMMALGKVINPATNKAEKNLPAARLFIDTLDMLERKTVGNLTEDETKVLQATLTDLRLMYAEEAKSAEKGGRDQTTKSASPAEASPADTTEETTPETKVERPAGEVDESKVRFHKKYGEE